MGCSNCFNGCAEIVSDQCVKYTGIDIPVLGIKNGDSLSYVEQALIEFLTSTLDGTGIKIDITPGITCTLVQQYLPTCGDITAVNIFEALIKAACDLQNQITSINGQISTINTQISTIEASYTIPSCLTGVTSTSGTHAILQSVITAFCAFVATVETTYVNIVELPILIGQYIANQPSSTLVKTKLVPYIVYEYRGSLTNFDATGAGTGDWIDIYICNGLNGTPDKRGVVTAGAIVGVPGGPLSSIVNPSVSPFNPNYSLSGAIVGANSILLTQGQLPSHVHDNTFTLTDPGHSHAYGGVEASSGNGVSERHSVPITRTTDIAYTGITFELTNASAGGNEAHANIQPTMASYYIMYIP